MASYPEPVSHPPDTLPFARAEPTRVSGRSIGTPHDHAGMDLSLVIPFHNEEACCSRLLIECLEMLNHLPEVRAEVIAVDDGSDDRTRSLILDLAEKDERVRLLTFPRNLGQAPALYHGVREAVGELIVTLDGDGQNDPADIPALLGRLRESGVDLVSGVRVDRQDTRLRRCLSRLANRIRRAVLADGVSDSGCALKAFRRSVVDSLIPIRTLYSFIPALARAGGYSVTEWPVAHRPREGGVSHYGLGPFLWRPALDMLGVWWFTRRSFETRNPS